jgi:hypothetical protein
MPGFGDTFVQSMQFGTKIASDEQQHAEAIAQKDKELQASQAMEALKMDALNRQITIAEETKANQVKYQYDILHDARMKYAHDDYISVKGDPAFKNIPKTSAKQVMDMYNIGGISPDDEFVPKEQFAMVKARENYLWQLNMAEAKETAKTNKEDEFFKRMSELTKLANENVRGLTKETEVSTNPDYVAPSLKGSLGEGTGNYEFHNQRFKSSPFNFLGTLWKDSQWLASRIEDVGGLLKQDISGGPGIMKKEYSIDESKLGPAMDKQTEILQAMEIGLMDKKVNPKLAETYLDPQKSTLIQMADSRLSKDANGIPIALINTQGMSSATIGKIKDILDELRLRGLVNQAKDLYNQKTELQVEKLQSQQ